MKITLRNLCLVIVLPVLYGLLIAAFVDRGWGRLMEGSPFSFIPIAALASEVPHALVYFGFGLFASFLVRSSKTPFWILAICVLGCAMQAATRRWFFFDDQPFLEEAGIILSYFIAPWFAWLGYLIYKRKTANNELESIVA